MDSLDCKETANIGLSSNNDTRELVKHRVPGPRLNYRAFKYCAPPLYNSLPMSLRQLDDLGSFNNNLKTFINHETFDLESKVINEQFSTC